MRIALACLALAALAVLGCSDDAAPNNDAKNPDGPGSDAGCTNLEGEYIDLDSSSASFKGIPGATISVEGNPAVSITTPPNGRVMLCVPATDPVRLVIDAPTTYLDSSVYIEAEAIAGGMPPSLRSFTDERAATFYGERGLAYDDALGHILVFNTQDISDLSIDRQHGTTQAASSTNGTLTWADGAAGRYVLFPNVAIGQPATLSGDAGKTHVLPVEAGKLTIAVIHTVFL